jgi:hypothetical protein
MLIKGSILLLDGNFKINESKCGINLIILALSKMLSDECFKFIKDLKYFLFCYNIIITDLGVGISSSDPPA